jgi:hypothetical protein
MKPRVAADYRLVGSNDPRPILKSFEFNDQKIEPEYIDRAEFLKNLNWMIR